MTYKSQFRYESLEATQSLVYLNYVLRIAKPFLYKENRH